MAIRYNCKCGAKIKLPDNAVGRKARCKTCSHIFTVPVDSIPEDEPIPWIDEFARTESETGDKSPVEVDIESQYPPPEPPPVPEQPQTDDEDDLYGEHEWIMPPERPFWMDLLHSFIFFTYPANLITFMFITLIHALTLILPFIPFIGCAGIILGWMLTGFIYGYLASFCMTVILETATGRDELPTVAFSDAWEELFMPLIRFIGSWLLVLAPAIILPPLIAKIDSQLAWYAVRILVFIGIFLWPVVLLCVAIGGGFRGLWPHMIIRTVISAPIAYLAIWITLLAAAGLVIFPATPQFTSIVQRFAPGAQFPLVLVNLIIGTYAMIVSMRSIGLYYRHHKKKFPWTAE
ncbi:MAG: zinc ribbon domain-containing protein [Planctomycetota bacterium]|jgi:hypothetical protein